MSESITRDEWLAAVREVEPVNDPSAMTLRELSAVFGTKSTATKARIDKLIAEGKAVVTSKRILDNVARVQHVPAYRLVKAKKGK